MAHTIIPCDLWHIRIVHVCYKALEIVSNVVTSLLEIHTNHEGVCKGCAQGKNTKNPFLSSNNKAKGILDIVHSYLCSPLSTTSVSGYVYYVSFIDDYSHKTWIYLLKGKDKVFGKFKEFKVLMENPYENNIKILRSDNGGEFKDFCKEVGIKRELTTPNNNNKIE